MLHDFDTRKREMKSTMRFAMFWMFVANIILLAAGAGVLCGVVYFVFWCCKHFGVI
jgi:hypothetical protein